MNPHDGSRIRGLAFSESLAFICKHSRWRTREMTRDCCFWYCFLLSYDEEDVCNGTRHNTMVINTQMEKPEKLQPYNSIILTNENIKQLKLYSLLLYIPVWSPTCLVTLSHASLFFAVVFEVPAGLVIRNAKLSHSLCQFFLALSLKGTGNECFDWLIIQLPIPIPFPSDFDF